MTWHGSDMAVGFNIALFLLRSRKYVHLSIKCVSLKTQTETTTVGPIMKWEKSFPSMASLLTNRSSYTGEHVVELLMKYFKSSRFYQQFL